MDKLTGDTKLRLPLAMAITSIRQRAHFRRIL
jgi:hypothetical protein